MTDAPTAAPWRNRSFAAALILGAATMAAVDEIVFHQLLRWHHFYDDATVGVGILSDGILHAAELFGFVAGFFLMLDAHRRGTFWPGAAWAGFLLGLGAFQLWDGVIDHKVLRLHQIRYGVDVLPYDIAWIGGAALLLIAGGAVLLVLRRRQRDAAKTASRGPRAPRGAPGS
ncbi:DUF2243 domain-containing protein [Microbacterium sp. 179-B 1A2 NHS]|uniref:DUF2243 domain-containing protein n=1 Tax=Microbacterium sp. 179-B 1A2 NHS TaxID=3142383 RepID=UPI0039A17F2A